MAAKKKTDDLIFLPLGGVGEIGMNFALYGYGKGKDRRFIIVDVGVTFPGDDFPGADLVLPDISYITQRLDKLDGIIITHAHEDHYGALLALWPMLKTKVWCTPFTAGMLEAKIEGERNAPKIKIEVFKAGEPFKVGPFEIEGIHVTHSIPEPVSLMIRSPLGNIIHTGDWKLDHAPTLGQKTDEAHFRRMGEEGVLALICDSTNAMVEGTSPSEESVSESLANVITNSTGRVLVTTFSSNVGRIRSIAMAAEKAGRKVMILGRSLLRVCDVSRDLGYLDGIAPFLTEDEYGSIARNKLVVICTGSQGEQRAALGKMSRGEHRNATLAAGDKVIFSSRSIPGNERGINDIQNALVEQGVEIVLDGETLVHVSGHPRRSELVQMYEWTKPTIGVPVHGEARHLAAHAKLMGEQGISDVAPVRNGDMLRLAPGPAEVIDNVTAGRIYKDGNLVGTEDQMGIARRRVLSWVGNVVIAMVIDSRGDLLADPEVVCEGLPRTVDGNDSFEDIIYDAALEAFEAMTAKQRRDQNRITQTVERAVRAEIRDFWGKKPLITALVTRV
ncbi:ribonuclease J [Ahrensia sp. R2A130]|uniref:ribonuclease J n=1 Tax=Ahrensia sp. R2A130 TaxID=744979 RepID=UPI0001E09BE6|nr:ribonuclease J [Ahrensia sp. R2A130]EFL90004.1 ribonuclease J [Ahrensia sp. R2A130]